VPMTVICHPGGAAPAAPHHGFATFDYDQTQHPAFGMVGVGAPLAPPGCCLALTMAWLHNWRTTRLAYSSWVGVGGGGYAGVLGHTVQVFAGPAGPAAWPATTSVLMAPMGFVPVGGLWNGPNWAGIVQGLASMVATARYTILVVRLQGGGIHATGILRAGQGIYFFDCNHGESYFKGADNFGDWFRSYKNPAFGYAGNIAGPQLWHLKYN